MRLILQLLKENGVAITTPAGKEGLPKSKSWFDFTLEDDDFREFMWGYVPQNTIYDTQPEVCKAVYQLEEC